MATSSKKTTSSVKTKAPTPTASPKVAPVTKKVLGETAPVEVVAKSPELKKNELIDRIIAKNGMKRKEVKPIVETMLAVMGEAIESGENLNLQPMGKLVIKKKKDLPNATVSICRIRRPKATS